MTDIVQLGLCNRKEKAEKCQWRNERNMCIGCRHYTGKRPDRWANEDGFGDLPF